MQARSVIYFSIWCFWSLLSCREVHQPSHDAHQTTVFQFLTESDTPILHIDTDLETLIKHKDQELPQKARLSYNFSDQKNEVIDMTISARGNTRKKYCDIPPIKLRFPSEFLRERGLAKYKSLKLVIPCKSGEIFEDLLLREYLTYQIFSEFTQNTFQTKLVKLAITNSKVSDRADERWAFLIEHEDEMAARLGGKLLEFTNEKIRSINQPAYGLLVLLQYMIGNTDWNLSKHHNVKLVDLGTNHAPIPVPYDFDYCGLVNADYAAPHPNLPIKNIRQRFLQWRGKDDRGLKSAIPQIQLKQNHLHNLVTNFNLLSQDSRDDILHFLQSFFEKISGIEPTQTLLGEMTQNVDPG